MWARWIGDGLWPGASVGPNLSGGGDGGPWELCEALRYDVRGDFVGFLINWKGGTEVQRVLLFLGLEMLCSARGRCVRVLGGKL